MKQKAELTESNLVSGNTIPISYENNQLAREEVQFLINIRLEI